MIQTVIKQLPQYIQQYSHRDQLVLNEFLEILKHVENVRVKRSSLIKYLRKYTEKLLNTEIYVQNPFLWFSEVYFSKAFQILSMTDFHAHSFYEYVVKQLRSSKNHPGVFELIRKNTPLTDLEWERLQYESSRMVAPLTHKQYEIIQKMFQLVTNGGINILDPNLVRKQLVSNLSTGFKTINELIHFFTTLEFLWHIDYHTSAFGISRLFCHIQIKKKQFEDILLIRRPQNTTLNMSRIYENRNKKQEYIGILYVPTNSIQSLKEFLKKQEQKGNIKIKKISPIDSNYRSISLNLYKPGEGWVKISSKYIQNIISQVSDPNTHLRMDIELLDYLSPTFNQKWSFKQHKLPVEIIKLYCETPQEYNFESLKADSAITNKNTLISIKNRGLLRQLFDNHVLNVSWVPWQIVFDFSLDSYWLNLPKIEINKLIPLLQALPFTMVYLSEDSTSIFTYITPEIAQSIKKHSKWGVYAIKRYYVHQETKFDWFDEKKRDWITPRILE